MKIYSYIYIYNWLLDGVVLWVAQGGLNARRGMSAHYLSSHVLLQGDSRKSILLQNLLLLLYRTWELRWSCFLVQSFAIFFKNIKKKKFGWSSTMSSSRRSKRTTRWSNMYLVSKNKQTNKDKRLKVFVFIYFYQLKIRKKSLYLSLFT